MSLLDNLIHLIHQAPPAAQHQQAAPQHQQVGYTAAQQAQMIPVGQPIPQSFMNSYSPQTRALAEIYQKNPQDPRVAHLDPKMFGYAPDRTQAPTPHYAAQNVHNMLPHYSMQTNFSTPVQGTQNPGFIPMQGSHSNRYMPLQNGYDQNIQV